MSEGSTSGWLLERINGLEGWIERQKGRPILLPARAAGGVVLILVLMVSNLVALALWPVRGLAGLLGGAGGARDEAAEPGAGEADGPTEPVPVDSAALARWLSDQRLVIVDFWAPWCGPCVMMSESLKEFAREVAGECVVCKVNTVEHADVAREHGVQGLPTLIVFVDGQEAARHTGALGKADLRRLVQPHQQE